MKDNWLDNLHDKVKDFETDAPDGLWDDIAADLHKRPARPWPVWLRSAAAVAAAAAVVAVVMHTGSPRSQPAIAEAVAEQAEPAAATVTVREHIAAANAAATHSAPAPLMAKAEAAEPAEMPVYMLDEFTVTPPDSADAPAQPSAMHGMHIRGTRNSRSAATTPERAARSSRVQLGVYTSGGLASAARSEGDLYMADWMGNEFGNGFMDSPTPPPSSAGADIRHRLPVKVGVQVGYRLSDRLTLSAGLMYTNLSSDLENRSMLYTDNGTQTLHYLGVPVSLQCGIASWKRLRFYASAGGAVEKCIAGSTRMERRFSATDVQTYTERPADKPWQLSVNAGLGLQFDLTRTVGIYAEPGVAWYFDNGSELRTIYEERPLNFNLNVGLRFTVGR